MVVTATVTHNTKMIVHLRAITGMINEMAFLLITAFIIHLTIDGYTRTDLSLLITETDPSQPQSTLAITQSNLISSMAVRIPTDPPPTMLMIDTTYTLTPEQETVDTGIPMLTGFNIPCTIQIMERPPGTMLTKVQN